MLHRCHRCCVNVTEVIDNWAKDFYKHVCVVWMSQV